MNFQPKIVTFSQEVMNLLSCKLFKQWLDKFLKSSCVQKELGMGGGAEATLGRWGRTEEGRTLKL
jgi:hypothetical protein